MTDKVPNKFHALQLFTDTFSAETVHLTNEQEGIYIRLLCFAWTKNTKPFSNDNAYRICQCINDNCKTNVDKLLKEFFICGKDGNSWTHKRLVEEHKFLTDKYNKQSSAGKLGMKVRYNSVNNKTITPIPIPKPIPNKNIYKTSFEKLWDLLIIKRGAKYKAFKVWQKCNTEMPQLERTAEIYNEQQKGKDASFVPHFSTWLSQKRWETQEQDQKFHVKHEPTIVDKYKSLGYQHRGSEGQYEQFLKGNKKYRLHKFKPDAQLETEP